MQMAKGRTYRAELVPSFRDTKEVQSMGGGTQATRETGGGTADGPESRIKRVRQTRINTEDEV